MNVTAVLKTFLIIPTRNDVPFFGFFFEMILEYFCYCCYCVCVCVNILYLMLVLHDKCTLCRPEEILHPCFLPYFTGNTRCELRHSLYIILHDFGASSKLHTTSCLYAVTCSCSSSALPSNTTSKGDDAFPHCILRPTAPLAH